MTTLARFPVQAAPAVRRGRLRRVMYAADLDPSRKFGSLEEQAFLLASAFGSRGGLFLPVYSAAPEPDGRSRYRDAELEYANLDLTRFRAGTLSRLLRLIARRNIEVIDWNFYAPLTNAYVWALTVLAPGVGHMFTDHNSRAESAPTAPGRLKWAKRILLRRYGRVVGVSRYVAERLRGQRVWPEPLHRLHFINTDRFAPDPTARAAVRSRLGAAGGFVLLAVAHLIRAKGIDVALRALARLPESAVLWAVGDGDETAPLERLAAELNVANRVRFLGLQSRVEPYMQAADAFVCPSLWAEAAGLVNIEAQSCGLPVLASRVGGIPEYVIDGRTGVLFPPGDAEALAAAARLLMDRPERRREMGLQARRWAEEQFSVAARIDDYLDLYRSPIEEAMQ